jgi:hypothetical protein
MMKNKGSIFYVVVLILGVLAAIGALVVDLGVDESQATQMVIRSEKAMQIAEAIVEEFFFNAERMMNSPDSGPVSGLYDKLRQTTSESMESIELDPDKDIPKYLVPNSLAYCAGLNKEGEENTCVASIAAQIKDIKRININPMTETGYAKGIKVDPVEKDAVLEIGVEVVFEGYSKSLVVTRSLKVVNTTIPLLSVFTLFVNEAGFPLYSQWSSKMGAPYKEETTNTHEQPSIVLDNGWGDVLGSSTLSLAELREGFEEYLMQGKVSPGRIYLNSGIVPLTNGNRESGMLQNAFFSAETEFLPPTMVTDFESFKQELSQKASSGSMAQEEKDIMDLLPESGKLYTRYVGYGSEVQNATVEVNGKERAGYLSYFECFKNSDAWSSEDHRKSPSKSGLDLYGRVELKPTALEAEDEEKGIFGKIIDAVGDITESIMQSFINDNYNVYTSPTFVYGKAFQSYFKVMDYKYTRGGELEKVWKARKEREGSDRPWYARWWDGVKEIGSKLLNTFKVGVIGPGQYPIPEVPASFLEDIPESQMQDSFGDSDQDLSKFLAIGWSKETYENFLDLPSGLRTPAFLKYLQTVRKVQQNFFDQDLGEKVPEGAILAPYNNGIANYLKGEYQGSKIQDFFYNDQKGLVKLTGSTFLSNEIDREMDAQWGNDYISPLQDCYDEVPLAMFNPFLYYHKATDYISSIVDYRKGEEEGTNVIKEKYYNEKDNVLELDGVIYITGTSHPLKFSEFLSGNAKSVQYKGKAIIVTFGQVVFDCGLNKYGYSFETGLGPQGKDNSVLTIVALGGITFQTNEPVQASVYSFMFPPRADRWFRLHGTMGTTQMNMGMLPRGGVIKFDPSYHIENLSDADKKAYYYASLTDEIKKYSWRTGWK